MNGTTVVNTIATGYNADGEVTSAGDSDSNYAFGYDGQGHLAAVDNAGTPGVKDFLNSYSYDTLSRLTRESKARESKGSGVKKTQ